MPIHKLILTGVKKITSKKMAKRTTGRSQKAINEANRLEGVQKELLSYERMLIKTKNKNNRKTLQDKIVKLKYELNKIGKAPKANEDKQYLTTDKIGKKKVNMISKSETKNSNFKVGRDVKDSMTPNFLKPQVGLATDKVTAKAVKKTKSKKGADYLPEIFKKQAI